MKRQIHTTLEKSTYEKLIKYGGGSLNAGIEKAVEISESKMYNVREELRKIADKVLVEVASHDENVA